MGRLYKVAEETDFVIRLELSYLLKNGFVKQGKHIQSGISWSNGNTISIDCNMVDGNSYLRLHYHNTSYLTGDVSKQDYRVSISSVPSNLGIGNVLYFVCPESGKRARILYKCYGSLIFKHRAAYRKRVYYPSQSASKYEYHNTMFWKTERLLDKLCKEKAKSHYRGKPTRLLKRINQLELKSKVYDKLRFLAIYKRLKGWNPDDFL